MTKPSKIEKKLLHYTGKAIADYKMINSGDKVLVCLSGGKDSYALVKLLHLLKIRSNHKFEITVFNVNPNIPGWDDTGMHNWVSAQQLPFVVEKQNIFDIAQQKVKPGKTICGLCSRLRRGIIYRYAKENNFNKIALGHHRDDLITSLLMSILYNGIIASQPPKLLSKDKQNILIRPLAYCQERDIIKYANEQQFPCMPKGLCKEKENKTRQATQKLISDLAKNNPKIPSNILNALSNIKLSQLMDKNLWDFNFEGPREQS